MQIIFTMTTKMNQPTWQNESSRVRTKTPTTHWDANLEGWSRNWHINYKSQGIRFLCILRPSRPKSSLFNHFFYIFAAFPSCIEFIEKCNCYISKGRPGVICSINDLSPTCPNFNSTISWREIQSCTWKTRYNEICILKLCFQFILGEVRSLFVKCLLLSAYHPTTIAREQGSGNLFWCSHECLYI